MLFKYIQMMQQLILIKKVIDSDLILRFNETIKMYDFAL